MRDAGELGIANVPVTLTGTDVLGNAVNLATTTDASGNWFFDGLLAAGAAGYTVTEGAIPPASGTFADGRETAGSLGGSAAVNDVISGIALTAGAQPRAICSASCGARSRGASTSTATATAREGFER